MQNQLNKQIFYIDTKYRSTLRIVIRDVIKNWTFIPITWEDIYYEFLYQVGLEFASKKVIFQNLYQEKSYLWNRCKNFARNKCRTFSTHRFQSLNQSLFVESNSFLLQDAIRENHDIYLNLNVLTALEKKVMQEKFLEGKTRVGIAKNLKISPYFVKKIENRIKDKLLKEYKK